MILSASTDTYIHNTYCLFICLVHKILINLILFYLSIHRSIFDSCVSPYVFSLLNEVKNAKGKRNRKKSVMFQSLLAAERASRKKEVAPDTRRFIHSFSNVFFFLLYDIGRVVYIHLLGLGVVYIHLTGVLRCSPYTSSGRHDLSSESLAFLSLFLSFFFIFSQYTLVSLH